MSTDHQIAANRANARLSTGPRTANGKARSASNNLRHGLASGRLILPGEDPADFDELVEGLRAEYDPATPTESQLILRMAQNFWLSQRAIRLQNDALLAGYTPDKLALLLRYQTSNDRGYHQCLTKASDRTGQLASNRKIASSPKRARRRNGRALVCCR